MTQRAKMTTEASTRGRLGMATGLALLLPGWGCGEAPSAPTSQQDTLSTLVEPGARLETAASIVFTEGPAADAKGGVYFSDITGNRILRWTSDGGWTEFRKPSFRANGLAFDPEGRLLACEGNGSDGGRRVSRTDLETGRVEILADRYEGKRLNSPNDLILDRRGRIYFTDPRYGSQEGRELETEDVYRIDPDGTLTRVATRPEVYKPNGIAISPDGRTLYLADTRPEPDREARLLAFDLHEDGSLHRPRILYSFGTGRGVDGMAVEPQGNIFGAAGRGPSGENRAGIYVLSRQGELLGRIPIPEDTVTNCTFGGPDRKTLFVTAGKNLYRIRLRRPGHLLYPPLG